MAVRAAMLPRPSGTLAWRAAASVQPCSCRFATAAAAASPRALSKNRPLLQSAKAKGKRKAKDPVEQFYSDSLNLPKTAFPLRAEANRREKLFWDRTTDGLYRWQVRTRPPTYSCFVSAAHENARCDRKSKRTGRCLSCTTDRPMRTATSIAVRLVCRREAAQRN